MNNVILEIKQELSYLRIERDKKLLAGDNNSFLELNSRLEALEWVLGIINRYKNE